MLATRLCSSWDSVGMVGFMPLWKWSSLAVSIEISLSTGVRLISVIRMKNNFWACLLLKAVESDHDFSTGDPNLITDSVFTFDKPLLDVELLCLLKKIICHMNVLSKSETGHLRRKVKRIKNNIIFNKTYTPPCGQTVDGRTPRTKLSNTKLEASD